MSTVYLYTLLLLASFNVSSLVFWEASVASSKEFIWSSAGKGTLRRSKCWGYKRVFPKMVVPNNYWFSYQKWPFWVFWGYHHLGNTHTSIYLHIFRGECGLLCPEHRQGRNFQVWEIKKVQLKERTAERSVRNLRVKATSGKEIAGYSECWWDWIQTLDQEYYLEGVPNASVARNCPNRRHHNDTKIMNSHGLLTWDAIFSTGTTATKPLNISKQDPPKRRKFAMGP